jgi:hypothetical protein
MGRIGTGIVLATALGCAGATRGPAGVDAGVGSVAMVDHVIVAIDTLERGIALLERATGVRPAMGGVHPGRGTQNALLSLGAATYLELLAPNPADSAGPATVTAMAGYRDLTPVGWAAGTADAGALHRELTARGVALSELRPGSRRTPAGDTLRWVSFAPPALATEWQLPFFIAWGVGTPHPARSAPAGCTLTGLTVRSPIADSLRGQLRDLGLDVAVEAAPRRAMRLELDCPTGRVTLAAMP